MFFAIKRIVNRLVQSKPSLAGQIWERIKAFLQAFGKAGEKDPTEIQRLRRTEELFRRALESAGEGYIAGELARVAEENAAGEVDGQREVQYNSNEVQRSAKRAQYIPYARIGQGNVAAIRRQLSALYQGAGNSIANGIAIAVGNTVYIVDSGKENGEITFGVRKKITISNAELRAGYIRSTNDESVSKGYVSDELSSGLGTGHDNDRRRDMRREPGAELSADTGASSNNQGGVPDANANRGGAVKKSRKPVVGGGTYTEEQYRRFGWVRANEVLTSGEWEDFTAKLAGAVSGQTHTPKTKSGEYMIAVSDVQDPDLQGINNIIVYAKGTIESPQVTRVLRIDLDNETELDIERRNIYAAERRGIQQEAGELRHLYVATNFQNRHHGQGNGTQESRDHDQLGVERSGGRRAADRIKEFHVNDDGSFTTIYADGRKEIRYSRKPVGQNNGQSDAREGGQPNGSQDTAILAEQGGVWRAHRNADGVWEPGTSPEEVYRILGDAQNHPQRDGERRAGSSGWLGDTNAERRTASRLSGGLLRALRGIKPKGTDSAGRRLSDELRKRLANTTFKAEDGTILSLYHWTDAIFTRFLKGDVGFHFGALDAAYKRADDQVPKRNSVNSFYKEVYLNITNPIFLNSDPSRWMPLTLAYKMKKSIVSDADIEILKTLDGFYEEGYNTPAAVELRRMLKEKGYDGVIYTNLFEGDFSVIAFDPEQVITVAENGVDIRPTDGRIRYSRKPVGQAVRTAHDYATELYTSTDAYAKEVHSGDRETFNRWLANKTSGMAEGEIRSVAIYCAQKVYFFEADGYMHGRMLRSVNVDDNEGYERERKDFKNEFNRNRETFDSWSDAFSAERARTEGDLPHSSERRGEVGSDALYAGESERERTANYERSGRDYQIDFAEVDDLVRRLREMHARLDAESKKNIRYSRKPTEGQAARDHADNNHLRVYTKKDAREILSAVFAEHLGFADGTVGNLSGKNRTQVIETLWRRMNEAEPGNQGGVALDIADFILHNAVAESAAKTKTANPSWQGFAVLCYWWSIGDSNP